MEIKKKEAVERAEIERRLHEFRKAEKALHRVKRRAERQEAKIKQAELAVEFRELNRKTRAELEELRSKVREQARIARIQARKERRKIISQFIQSHFRRIIYSYRFFSFENIRGLSREFRSGASKRKTFAIISINSTVLFLLAYLCLFLLSQATTVIAASFFDYPTVVYYYEIFFNISPEAWYHDSVKTIFSAGPLINLVIGIAFIIIYNNLRETTSTFKFFFLWGFLHAIGMLFGAMLVGTLFETGLGHVISWMYVMDTGRMLYSIISLFILAMAGLLVTKPILFSGNSYFSNIAPNNNSFFIFAQVVVPFIIGNAALFIIRQPRIVLYDTLVGLTMIISIISVMMTYRTYNVLYFEEEKKQYRIDWPSLAILFIIVLFFRGILALGIRFGA